MLPQTHPFFHFLNSVHAHAPLCPRTCVRIQDRKRAVACLRALLVLCLANLVLLSVCLLCAYRLQRASAYWRGRASPTAKSRKSAFFAGAPAHVCICVCESPRRAFGRGWGQDIRVCCMQRRTHAGVRRPCHDFTLFACQYTVISCMQMHCDVSCWRATPLS